jgi:hypothetical protein
MEGRNFWILLVFLCYGFAPSQNRTLTKEGILLHEKVIRPTVYFETPSSKHQTTALLSRDSRSGAVRSIRGQLGLFSDARRNQENFESWCRAFVDTHEDIFGISSQDLRIVSSAFLLTNDVTFVKFHVYRNDRLIWDAAIDFHFKGNVLVQVLNASFSEATEISTGVKKEKTELRTLLTSQFPLSNIETGDEYFRVQETDIGYELLGVSSYKVRSATQGDFLVEMEQESGRIFEWKEADLYFDGVAQAEIYPRWYTETPVAFGIPFATLNQSDRSLLHTDQKGRFSSESRGDLPGLQGLSGLFVTNHLVSGSVVSQKALETDTGWKLYLEASPTQPAWIDNTMAQPMVYYHANAIIQEAKRFVASPWLTTPLQANINLMRTCNAHWDGKTINLYSGDKQCANTGLISDVVYHEWGHGLHANAGGIKDRAFSEGFGDIMSLVMTHSSQLGIGFFAQTHKPVRNLEQSKIYPRDRGMPHSEGLIIGSTFWDLFGALREKYGEDKAGEILKNYAFKMIFTASTYLDVYATLLVIDDDDANPLNGTPNLCLLNPIFVKHGLAKEDSSCTVSHPT